jgi:hypothetical protein
MTRAAARVVRGRLETPLEVNRQLSVIQPVESLLQRIAEACGRVFTPATVAAKAREALDAQPSRASA